MAYQRPGLTNSYVRPSSSTAISATGLASFRQLSPAEETRHYPREITVEVSRSLAGRPWFKQLVKKLEYLANLEANWNGYGEQPVHSASVKRVVGLLNSLDLDVAPSIAPTPAGSLQVEWHRSGASVEVEVPSQGRLVAWYSEKGRDEEEMWEVVDREALRRIRTSIKQLVAS